MNSSKSTNIIISVLILIIFSILSIASIELIGQKLIFKGRLYFVNNIDHWNNPAQLDINSDCIRSQFEADYFRKNDYTVIFLGDSYIFGWLLPPQQSIPQQFEGIARKAYPHKNIKAANFGWVSSSPLLSYRLLESIGEKYQPDLVILGIDMTDFHDDIKYQRLLERKGIYRLLDVCPITVLCLKHLLQMTGLDQVHKLIFGFPRRRFFITEQPLPESMRWLKYIRNNIERINHFCRTKLRARFLVIVLPRSFQYNDLESPQNWEKKDYPDSDRYIHEPFKWFDQIATEVEYPIFSLLPIFQNTKIYPTCFYDDPHWTELGNRVAAEAIFEYLRDNGYFEQ